MPLLATNDVLYHVPERRPLQDVLTCIREHLHARDAGTPARGQCRAALEDAAGDGAPLPRPRRDAIGANAASSLERCRFSLDELATSIPTRSRGRCARPQEALIASPRQARAGAIRGGVPEKVAQALDHELALIASSTTRRTSSPSTTSCASPARKDILCQGRGSAANSAVCYCLGITEVDPARVDLLFERFISAERNEPPDIDVDFEHERREEVIQYVYEQIRPRPRRHRRHRHLLSRALSAVREVGKAFGLSDDTVGALAGMLGAGRRRRCRSSDARRVGLDPADRTSPGCSRWRAS